MKFSIRDLLLMTVIVALAVGWWMEHREGISRQKDNERMREALISARDAMDVLSGRVNHQGPVLIPNLDAVIGTTKRSNTSAPAPNSPKP